MSEDEEFTPPPPKKSKTNSKLLKNANENVKDTTKMSKQVIDENVLKQRGHNKAKENGQPDFTEKCHEGLRTRELGPPDFTCDNCDFYSQDSKDYSRHIRHEHVGTDDKIYSCDKCKFSTFNR